MSSSAVPGGGELDPAGGAPEERRAEVLLQAAHGTTQVGLRQVQPLGRPAEVQLLGDRHEHLQLLGSMPDPPTDASIEQ